MPGNLDLFIVTKTVPTVLVQYLYLAVLLRSLRWPITTVTYTVANATVLVVTFGTVT